MGQTPRMDRMEQFTIPRLQRQLEQANKRLDTINRRLEGLNLAFSDLQDQVVELGEKAGVRVPIKRVMDIPTQDGKNKAMAETTELLQEMIMNLSKLVNKLDEAQEDMLEAGHRKKEGDAEEELNIGLEGKQFDDKDA